MYEVKTVHCLQQWRTEGNGAGLSAGLVESSSSVSTPEVWGLATPQLMGVFDVTGCSLRRREDGVVIQKEKQKTDTKLLCYVAMVSRVSSFSPVRDRLERSRAVEGSYQGEAKHQVLLEVTRAPAGYPFVPIRACLLYFTHAKTWAYA